MIPWLLPLLQGWRYEVIDLDTPVELRTPEHVITVVDKPGWLVTFFGVVDNPDTLLVLEGVGPYEASVRVDLTPREVYESGYRFWTPRMAYTPLYDESRGLYALAYTPIPWLAFRSARAIARPPPGARVRLLNAYAELVVVEDREAFESSLRRVLGHSI